MNEKIYKLKIKRHHQQLDLIEKSAFPSFCHYEEKLYFFVVKNDETKG
jgi:hypothetical protein